MLNNIHEEENHRILDLSGRLMTTHSGLHAHA